MNLKLVLVVVFLLLFVLFVVQNAQVVTVSFLFWKIEASRAIVLLVTFILGLVSGWLLTQIIDKKTSDR